MAKCRNNIFVALLKDLSH